MSFDISYIIATRNRLPQLKITLDKLIDELLPNEEIVVVDGNSSDGANKYLQELFVQGKIHQFTSEPDRNQGHGWNKALLMARGTIIKKIIDDDVHHYPSIRKCASYILANPQVDICISNCLTTDITQVDVIAKASRAENFKAWKAGSVSCFTFSDVYMLLRKSALSYIGLYDTQFVMLDWEYSLRASFLKAGIAYYNGYNSIAVNTPGNVTSATTVDQLKTEELIGKQKYGYQGDRSDISLYSELKIAIGKIVYKASPAPVSAMPPADQLPAIYAGLYDRLDLENRTIQGNFIS